MNHKSVSLRLTGILSLCAVVLPTAAHSQANSWTNTAAIGLWQDATKWSLLAAPTSTHTAVFITNVNTKTVTINSATPAGNLTINNLTVQGFSAGINTLELTNMGAATPLRILNVFTLGTNAVLAVTNSVLRVDGLGGLSFIVDGSLTNLAGGQILTTDLAIGFSATSRGNLTTLGALLQASNAVIVGYLSGSQGALTLAGGSNIFNTSFTVGQNGNATGAVWMTGGQLVVTNTSNETLVGSGGAGQMTVSNGNWRSGGVRIGNAAGARGVLTLAGGTNTLNSLTIGFNANATGTVWLTGGQLVVTNNSGSVQVGRSGVGQMTVSNGTWQARAVFVGYLTGSQGTLTVAGGTNSIDSDLTVGYTACTATGIVNVTGGSLFVTNSSGIATLEVRSGTLTQSGGTVTVNRLVITNACARFIKSGGALSATTTNLGANLSAVGDGIPNGWKQQYRLEPFDPNLADTDTDGDGFANLEEFRAGTDPTNSASYFGITAITRVSTNILLKWSVGVGKTSAVERAAGAAGSFTNAFTTISSGINTNFSGIDSYLDVGAATNVPAFYYRVRLVP